MSFLRIPAKCCTDPVPSSTKIKEDCLESFTRLETILDRNERSGAYWYKVYDEEIAVIVDICNVFNENVNYVNNEIENFTDPKGRTFENEDYSFTPITKTFEKYCYSFTPQSMLSMQEDCRTEDEAKEEFEALKKANEVYQLAQLHKNFESLSRTIKRTIEHLQRFETYEHYKKVTVARFPKLAVPMNVEIGFTQLQVPLIQFESTIRKSHNLEERVKRSEALATAETTPVQSQSSVVSAKKEELSEIASSVTVETIPVEALSLINVLVSACHVGDGSLGICCEPSWDKSPVAFTKGDKGWTGQAPIGKEWKFVLLQNGQVQKWETAKNRKCEGPMELLILNNSYDVRFR